MKWRHHQDFGGKSTDHAVTSYSFLIFTTSLFHNRFLRNMEQEKRKRREAGKYVECFYVGRLFSISWMQKAAKTLCRFRNRIEEEVLIVLGTSFYREGF